MRVAGAGALGLAFVSLACAARAPIILDSEIVYPAPEVVSCTPDGRGPTRLAVRVQDISGAAVAGAALYLAPMSDGGRVVPAQTNDDGVAELTAATGGPHALTVVLTGLLPQVRALALRPGCDGATVFTIRVGPSSLGAS